MITTHGYLSLTPPLALAVREGRKTQTMRPVTRWFCRREPARWEHVEGRRWHIYDHAGDRTGDAVAPHAPGDVLWVREPARVVAVEANERGEPEALIEYIADNVRRWVPHPPRLKGLIPGRRIPNGCHREAARTYVRVMSVEPRRVQSITEEEAQAEGLDPVPVHGRWAGPREEGGHWSARRPFAELWDSLYRAKGLGWDADPWCWCVRFERVEAP